MTCGLRGRRLGCLGWMGSRHPASRHRKKMGSAAREGTGFVPTGVTLRAPASRHRKRRVMPCGSARHGSRGDMEVASATSRACGRIRQMRNGPVSSLWSQVRRSAGGNDFPKCDPTMHLVRRGGVTVGGYDRSRWPKSHVGGLRWRNGEWSRLPGRTMTVKQESKRWRNDGWLRQDGALPFSSE